MPNVNDLGTSNYIAKSDVGNGLLLTFKSYEKKNVGIGKKDMQWVFYFDEHEKGFIMKPTNGHLVAAVVGSADFDDWIGKKIVLYIDPTVEFPKGKVTGGIRCRAPKNQPQQVEEQAVVDDDSIPF
jgi:hypothetical protein